MQCPFFAQNPLMRFFASGRVFAAVMFEHGNSGGQRKKLFRVFLRSQHGNILRHGARYLPVLFLSSFA
jgi:hypothetical protein